MAILTWNATALAGGVTGSLDSIPSSSLTDGDRAFVVDSGTLYYFVFDASSTEAESSPAYIRPDDYASAGVWVAQEIYPTNHGVSPPSGTELTGGIVGMNLSNHTDTDHDISVSIGCCMDSTNVSQITLSSAMVKRIDAAWSAGTGNGGLLNGSVTTNKIYHVYALRKDSDGSVDVGFLANGDTLATYLPSGYSKFRWLGYVVTDGSANIVNFVMIDEQIFFNSDINATSAMSSSSLTSVTLSSNVVLAGRVKAVRFLTASYAVEFSLAGFEIDAISQDTTGEYNSNTWVPINSDGSLYYNSSSNTIILKVKAVAITR